MTPSPTPVEPGVIIGDYRYNPGFPAVSGSVLVVTRVDGQPINPLGINFVGANDEVISPREGDGFVYWRPLSGGLDAAECPAPPVGGLSISVSVVNDYTIKWAED